MRNRCLRDIKDTPRITVCFNRPGWRYYTIRIYCYCARGPLLMLLLEAGLLEFLECQRVLFYPLQFPAGQERLPASSIICLVKRRLAARLWTSQGFGLSVAQNGRTPETDRSPHSPEPTSLCRTDSKCLVCSTHDEAMYCL